jgi:hypothetical protein
MIGVRLDLSLVKPQSVDSAVPHIVVPPDSPSAGNCKHPYSAGLLDAQADDVRGFMVLVDQVVRRVVEIDPRAHKVVYSRIAGRPRLTCREKFGSGG